VSGWLALCILGSRLYNRSYIPSVRQMLVPQNKTPFLSFSIHRFPPMFSFPFSFPRYFHLVSFCCRLHEMSELVENCRVKDSGCWSVVTTTGKYSAFLSPCVVAKTHSGPWIHFGKAADGSKSLVELESDARPILTTNAGHHDVMPRGCWRLLRA
jgi:hypothetical protein